MAQITIQGTQASESHTDALIVAENTGADKVDSFGLFLRRLMEGRGVVFIKLYDKDDQESHKVKASYNNSQFTIRLVDTAAEEKFQGQQVWLSPENYSSGKLEIVANGSPDMVEYLVEALGTKELAKQYAMHGSGGSLKVVVPFSISA